MKIKPLIYVALAAAAAGFCLFSVSLESSTLTVKPSAAITTFVSAATFNDDIALQFGTGGTVECRYETADANANALTCTPPEGGAVDVPVFVWGDASAENVDLGFFNGITSPAMAVLSDDQLSYIYSGHNQTDPIFRTNEGSFDFNALLQFSTGQAITGADYQVGRDADATNQLHFNVPTGAGFEFSVNDTAELVLNATNLQPGINDGLALGLSGTAFADLFLASGATIDFLAGDVVLTHSANTLTMTGGNFVLTQPVVDASAPTALTVTGGAHTALTAATEDIGANFNYSATKTWAAGAGPLALQREIVFQAPTYAGNAGGALVMTEAATVAITDAPTQGANMTLSETHALFVMAGSSAFGGNVQPRTTDGAALGTTALMWSDLFLATGGVLNWNNGTTTITQAAQVLTFFNDAAMVIRLDIGSGNAAYRNWAINNGGQTVGNLDFQVSAAAGGVPTGTTPKLSITSAGYVGIGGSPTHFFQITAGTLASTIRGLYLSSTFTDAAAGQVAADFQITTAGTLNTSMTGLDIRMLAGYTGTGYSYGANISTAVAATSADWISAAANIGVLQQSLATTVGDNVGNWSRAYGGNVNIAVAAQAITAKNGATNIGVIGLGKNTGTTPIQVGGYFGLNATEPTFASAALMADNSDQTSDIFVARDNGTAVFSVVDGGAVQFGTAGVSVSNDGDGAITFLGLGNGSDEDLTLNLDDTANTITATSSTGVTTVNFSGMAVTSTACTSVLAGEFNPTEAGATDDYLNLIDNSFSATEADEDQFMVPVAMVARNLRAEVDVAPGVGNDAWAITLRDDAGSTTLTCTIDEAATNCSDTSNAPAIAAGSKLDVLVTSSGPGTDPTAAAVMNIAFCLSQ